MAGSCMHGSCTTGACPASTCHAQALIKCSAYGDPARFSDPSIGAAVNDLARTGAVSAPLTLQEPVNWSFVMD